jgi:hypothetical protein
MHFLNCYNLQNTAISEDVEALYTLLWKEHTYIPDWLLWILETKREPLFDRIIPCGLLHVMDAMVEELSPITEQEICRSEFS